VVDLACASDGEERDSRVVFEAPMVWRGTVRPGLSNG
jgi:hypothetical protein